MNQSIRFTPEIEIVFPNITPTTTVSSTFLKEDPPNFSIMFAGRILSHKKSKVAFGKRVIEFYVIKIETGMGIVDCIGSLNMFTEKDLEMWNVILASGEVVCDCAVKNKKYYKTPSIG